jgi:hypothetical protein
MLLPPHLLWSVSRRCWCCRSTTSPASCPSSSPSPAPASTWNSAPAARCSCCAATPTALPTPPPSPTRYTPPARSLRVPVSLYHPGLCRSPVATPPSSYISSLTSFSPSHTVGAVLEHTGAGAARRAPGGRGGLPHPRGHQRGGAAVPDQGALCCAHIITKTWCGRYFSCVSLCAAFPTQPSCC